MPDAIAGALIALGGGVVALLGQALIQRLVHGLNRAKERDALLRDKAEAVVDAMIEHEEWFDVNTRPFEPQAFLNHYVSYNRARALQRLYFPAVQFGAINAALAVATILAIDELDAKGLNVVGFRDAAFYDRLSALRLQHNRAVQGCIDEFCETMTELM